MLVQDAKQEIDEANNFYKKSKIVGEFENKLDGKCLNVYRTEVRNNTNENMDYTQIAKIEIEVISQLIDYLENFEAEI